MEIISVTEKDWKELKTIRLAALKESPDAFSASYETALNFTESQWRSRASGTEGCNFFIAKNDSYSIGIIGGVYKTGDYELISLWVSPSYRKHGIAKLLVNRIIQHARELKKDFIFLEVQSSNIPACSLYEQCGFRLATNNSKQNGAVRNLNRFQLSLKV